MWKIYGLTGGIASGKSSFGRFLAKHQATVIDADQIARNIVEPGSEGLQKLIDAFGEEILRPDGQLHRQVLGDIVFEDKTARQTLNAITHPLIAQKSAQRMAEAAAQEHGPVFYEAALLVENDSYQQFAGLVVVEASPKIQIERAMRRDHLTRKQAQARLDAQMPMRKKSAVADYLITNEGSLEELEDKARKLLQTLRAD